MMNKVEFGRCPFCGSKVKLMWMDESAEDLFAEDKEWTTEVDPKAYTYVQCKGCNSSFHHGAGRAKEVIKWWDDRKPINQIVKRLKDQRGRSFNVNWKCAVDKAIEIVKEITYVND